MCFRANVVPADLVLLVLIVVGNEAVDFLTNRVAYHVAQLQPHRRPLVLFPRLDLRAGVLVHDAAASDDVAVKGLPPRQRIAAMLHEDKLLSEQRPCGHLRVGVFPRQPADDEIAVWSVAFDVGTVDLQARQGQRRWCEWRRWHRL